ncbi:phosphatidylinositol N-acetylglucosaminyltransferase subunit gpi1, partial [Ascosphaera acerosa]
MVGDGLLRVFWPSDLSHSPQPGVIVGWKNSDHDLFVLTVLQRVEAETVEDALKAGVLLQDSPYPISRIFALCRRGSLHVLGLTNCSVQLDVSDASRPTWLWVDTTHSRPEIRCHDSTLLAIQVVMFERPLPYRMQYMSLKPLTLALIDRTSPSSHGVQSVIDDDETIARKATAELVEKLKYHTVIKHSASQHEQTLPAILNQINSAYEIESLVKRNAALIGMKPARNLSVSERVVQSVLSIWGGLLAILHCTFNVWLWPILRQGMIVLVLCHRVAAEIVLRILEWRAQPEAAALKDISATAQQIDIRLQQFCYWPVQHLTLRRRKDDWKSVTDSHPDYIRFYNSLWLVANDVIIGIALGSYIVDNADWVAQQINRLLSVYTVAGLQRTISWLMGWPAGLKLNNELAVFLGDLFLWVIERWAIGLENLRPFLKDVMQLMGYCSFAGASMPIAMLSDLLSMLTLHIYCFYVTSARIFNWQLTTLISLFHLFRGRKRNVLRNRIDYCDYDLDQLLLGTILFTLLFFLLPTVVVFYVAFASARMILIFCKAALDTLLAFLNHFPLFAVMLRIKDPKRLPGGIHFALEPRSTPLSLREMFVQYFQLGHRLRKHYLSPRVILCLITGHFIPPIDRRNMYSLQYMMLPVQRVGVGEVWEMLTEDSGRAAKRAASSAR